MNIDTIKKNITKFFNDNTTGWDAVPAMQNQPKISDNQIVFYIENLIKIEGDQWTTASQVDASVDFTGIRELTLSVDFTGEGATQGVSDFLDILEPEEINELLLTYGLVNIDVGDPVQVPTLRGDKYVERIEFQWMIRTTTSYTSDAGRIEQGTITGDVEDHIFETEYSI